MREQPTGSARFPLQFFRLLNPFQEHNGPTTLPTWGRPVVPMVFYGNGARLVRSPLSGVQPLAMCNLRGGWRHSYSKSTSVLVCLVSGDLMPVHATEAANFMVWW